MNNPFYSWIFSQQPQRIIIKSPQNGQDLNLFIHSGQSLPSAEELNVSQTKANNEVANNAVQIFLQITNKIDKHDKKLKSKSWDPLGDHDKINKRGRPRLKVNHDKILELKSANFTNKQIAAELGTTERQVYRLLKEIIK